MEQVLIGFASLHLGGAPEEEPIEAVSRYQRVVQRREKRRRVDACDALLSLSEVVIAITLVPHTDNAVFCCCFTHHMHICHAQLLLLSFLEVKYIYLNIYLYILLYLFILTRSSLKLN